MKMEAETNFKILTLIRDDRLRYIQNVLNGFHPYAKDRH